MLGAILLAVVTHTSRVDVGGRRLEFHITSGKGTPIIFESGGGDDSSVWAGVAPAVARMTGAPVITYDRAGFGGSDPDPAGYDIRREAGALETGLKSLGLSGGVFLVAHSYGGFISTLFAARHEQQVRGVVLLDANVVQFFNDDEVSRLMAGLAADRDAVAAKNPALLKVLESFPSTVTTMRGVTFPPTVPVMDVVAEHPPFESGTEVEAWYRAHREFDQQSKLRHGVVARDSSHFVMRDVPDVVSAIVAGFYCELQP